MLTNLTCMHTLEKQTLVFLIHAHFAVTTVYLRYLHFEMAPPLKMLSMLLRTSVQSFMLLSCYCETTITVLIKDR